MLVPHAVEVIIDTFPSVNYYLMIEGWKNIEHMIKIIISFPCYRMRIQTLKFLDGIV